MQFDRPDKGGDLDAEKPDASIAFGRNVRRVAGDRDNIILLLATLAKRKERWPASTVERKSDDVMFSVDRFLYVRGLV